MHKTQENKANRIHGLVVKRQTLGNQESSLFSQAVAVKRSLVSISSLCLSLPSYEKGVITPPCTQKHPRPNQCYRLFQP